MSLDLTELLWGDDDSKTCVLIDRHLMEWDEAEMPRLECRVFDSGNETVYRYLIGLRPDLINASTHDGYTTLHCAAEYRPKRVPMLLELGANVNLMTEERGKTPLDGAYFFHERQTIRLLLENGASTMIGMRLWGDSHKALPPPNMRGDEGFVDTRWILRAHYIALLHGMPGMLSDHLRMVVEMLA